MLVYSYIFTNVHVYKHSSSRMIIVSVRGRPYPRILTPSDTDNIPIKDPINREKLNQGSAQPCVPKALCPKGSCSAPDKSDALHIRDQVPRPPSPRSSSASNTLHTGGLDHGALRTSWDSLGLPISRAFQPLEPSRSPEALQTRNQAHCSTYTGSPCRLRSTTRSLGHPSRCRGPNSRSP